MNFLRRLPVNDNAEQPWSLDNVKYLRLTINPVKGLNHHGTA